jgi:hypothetical protein
MAAEGNTKNSDNTVIGCRPDDKGSILCKNSNFPPCRHFQRVSGTHHAFDPTIGTVGSFSVVKRQKRDADHSPPSSAEVKNAWSFTSTRLTCLHSDVLRHRDNFTIIGVKIK